MTGTSNTQHDSKEKDQGQNAYGGILFQDDDFSDKRTKNAKQEFDEKQSKVQSKFQANMKQRKDSDSSSIVGNSNQLAPKIPKIEMTLNYRSERKMKNNSSQRPKLQDETYLSHLNSAIVCQQYPTANQNKKPLIFASKTRRVSLISLDDMTSPQAAFQQNASKRHLKVGFNQIVKEGDTPNSQSLKLNSKVKYVSQKDKVNIIISPQESFTMAKRDFKDISLKTSNNNLQGLLSVQQKGSLKNQLLQKQSSNVNNQITDESSILNRRSTIFNKFPKLISLLDEKFNEFFKRLCSPSYLTSSSIANAGISTQIVNNFNQSTYTQQQPSQNQSYAKQNTTTYPSGFTVNSLLKQEQKETFNLNSAAQGNSNQSPAQNQIQSILKNLRLQKANIKQHIAKRYGKPMSEKIVTIMESYNKQMHNIEVNEYINLIFHTIMSPQLHPTQSINVPNCYKFCFQVMDFGNKGFVCEHDLFQLVYAVYFERSFGSGTQGQTLVQEQETMNLSINYKDFLPQIKKNIFHDTFQADFPNIIRELEKIHHRNLSSNMNNQSYLQLSQMYNRNKGGKIGNNSGGNVSSTYQKTRMTHPNADDDQTDSFSQNSQQKYRYKSMNNSPSNSKGASSKSIYQQIAQNIYDHALNSIKIAQSTTSSTSNQNQTLTQVIQSTHINAFSHFNPIAQMIKEKKKQIQSNLINVGSTSNLMSPASLSCKQLTFDQFVKISFTNDIPQFIEDFFQHMTTLSLRELIKKLNPSNNQLAQQSQFNTTGGIAQIPKNIRKSLYPNRNQGNIGNVISDPLDERQYSIRNAQLQRIISFQHYDLQTLRKLTRTFALLAIQPQQIQINSSFHKLSTLTNISFDDNEEKLNIYLTLSAIQQNFSKAFSLPTQQNYESLSLRFYNILSNGVNMKRIYLPTFLMQLYPLIKGNVIQKNYFIFQLYDGDNDGLIQSIDLNDIMSNVLICPYQGEIRVCKCPLFKEIHGLYEDFVRKNIVTYKTKKLTIDFSFFMQKIQFSCLIMDFIDKLLMENNKPSMFSHDIKDIKKNTSYYEKDKEEQIEELQVFKKKNLLLMISQEVARIKHLQEYILSESNYTNIIQQQSETPFDNNINNTGGSDLDDFENFKIDELKNKQ